MLRHYRTLIRKPDGELPADLSLLDVKVAGRTSDDTHNEEWGRTEGVIFDEDREEIAYFVVRLYPGTEASRRVLVPVEAVTITYPEGSRATEDAVLRVDWTPDQLHAQPTFTDDDRLPADRFTGGPPVTSRWMPARPNVVPPGMRTSWAAAKLRALLWGGAGAALGAIFGLLTSGLMIGATLAVFFGLGAAIAGFMFGASREPAADASELDASRPAAVPEEIERLERAIRTPDLSLRDSVEQTRIRPNAVPGHSVRPAHVH